LCVFDSRDHQELVIIYAKMKK